MNPLNTSRRLLAGGLLTGALCFGTAAAAQTLSPVQAPAAKVPAPIATVLTLKLSAPKTEEPALAQSGYLCLSNSCAKQAQVAPPPGEGSAETREEQLGRLMTNMFAKVPPEELATGDLVVLDHSSGDKVDVQVKFLGRDGQVLSNSQFQLGAPLGN